MGTGPRLRSGTRSSPAKDVGLAVQVKHGEMVRRRHSARRAARGGAATARAAARAESRRRFGSRFSADGPGRARCEWRNDARALLREAAAPHAALEGGRVRRPPAAIPWPMLRVAYNMHAGGMDFPLARLKRLQLSKNAR